jgi:hypothetical protein
MPQPAQPFVFYISYYIFVINWFFLKVLNSYKISLASRYGVTSQEIWIFTEALYCLNLVINARRIAIKPRFAYLHFYLILMIYEIMSKLKIVESIIASLKSGKQTHSRLHSP